MDEIFSAGEKFHGYIIEKPLGKGGLGAVYLVRHELMELPFALKILYPRVASESPEYVRRFVREAKIASKIRNANLVAVHDVGYDTAKGIYFLIMDYVRGSDLRTAIALGGAMDPREAVRIVASVARALAAGEPFGVVHRDIKPENIMLEDDGTVKLVDLGVAKIKGTDSLRTMPKTIFGTPNYISPEQAMDSSAVDSRADIYSLGVVLYELLCGRRPYECDTPTEVIKVLLSPKPLPDIRAANPAVPQKLSMLLQLMLAKAPEKRIACASQLLDTLVRFGYGDVARENAVSTVATASYGAGKPDEKPFDYAGLSAAPANDTLSFKTQDREISEFVEKLKARKRRNKLLTTLAGVLGVIAALGLIIAILTW